jgi:hypothetical protein
MMPVSLRLACVERCVGSEADHQNTLAASFLGRGVASISISTIFMESFLNTRQNLTVWPFTFAFALCRG